MNRRTALLALLTLGGAPAPVDALLVGDSLAYQLGPRLFRAMRVRGRSLAYVGRGGSSARQWLRERWFRRAVRQHPAQVVLVSLGVNCTSAERSKLAGDIATIRALCPRPVLWLLPPPLKMSTEYLRQAVSGESFDPGPLPLESDGIHPTDAGHRKWAELIAEHLFR